MGGKRANEKYPTETMLSIISLPDLYVLWIATWN